MHNIDTIFYLVYYCCCKSRCTDPIDRKPTHSIPLFSLNAATPNEWRVSANEYLSIGYGQQISEGHLLVYFDPRTFCYSVIRSRGYCFLLCGFTVNLAGLLLIILVKKFIGKNRRTICKEILIIVATSREFSTCLDAIWVMQWTRKKIETS